MYMYIDTSTLHLRARDEDEDDREEEVAQVRHPLVGHHVEPATHRVFELTTVDKRGSCRFDQV
jgi:hypothetical protein